MILKQYYLGCLAHASYLVGDEAAGVAAVVDPQRDVDQYLEDAKRLGVRIEHVFLTHFHADFVAGHLELKERTGAAIHLGARAEAEYPFVPARDGDSIALGAVKLGILETPGHTPEGISITVFDTARDAISPQAVFTGDTLFIGDVGRPDLIAAIGITAADLAGLMHDSLHGKLLKLPDATLVYPAHGAGSMCGKNLSKETSSTLGQQRLTNYALQPMSRDAFIRMVTTDQPEAPAYFSYDAMLNRKARATLPAAMEKMLRPIPLDEVLRLVNAGACLLDVREPGEWAAAHLGGSVNIGLSGKFATWAGTLLDRERPIVIVAEPGGEIEAATRLGRIGFDQVVGYLDGGMHALSSRPELVQSLSRVAARELAAALGSAAPPIVLDVRNDGERADKRIPGSRHIPLGQLARRAAELPKGASIVVQCASGFRSMIAASLLERQGWHGLTDLIGGIAAWESLSLPVEVGRG
ncbi:MAG TPA: MBL fold metallo-hydrolase [Verrucomicrobiae bacterium]|nr:MBL fold metallo-hydrolase [Verrucomicrobiae bacterium]